MSTRPPLAAKPYWFDAKPFVVRQLGQKPPRRITRVLWLFLALVASAELVQAKDPLSNYDRDLADVNRRLSEPPVERTGASPQAVHAAMLAEKALLTEAPTDLTRARDAVGAVIEEDEPRAAFVALRAKLLLQLHEVRRATGDINWLERNAPLYPDLPGLQTDLLIEAGKFGAARALCDSSLRHRRTWPMLARLAQVDTLLAQDSEADALYLEAEDTLTVKEMRAFAWLEMQRGRIAASRGKWDTANTHYTRAEQAYSGLWTVASCRAEAAGAQGKYAEAIALYQTLAERTGRPELFQALGDLYRFSGNPAQAKACHDLALAGYLASTERGEVLYYHHLAEFYADVRGDGETALKWARRDCELRPGARRRQMLAWALYRKGAMKEALDEINPVVATGLQDAHLFQQAARLNAANGRDEEAKNLLRKAASLNPGYEGFHAHF